MPLARSRWLGPSAVALIAVATLFASCDKSSTSPNAAPSIDTISVNQGSGVVIEYYVQNGTPTFFSRPSLNGGAYVETYYENPAYYGDSRLIAEYPLPVLKGKRVVDSATMYWYVCSEYNDNDGGSGSRVPPRTHPSPFARGPLQSHARDGSNVTDTIVVDHILFGAVYQDSATYGGETLSSGMSVLVYGTDQTLGWKSASVTSAVQADYAAGRTASQYRLRYSSIASDGQDQTDFAGESCIIDAGTSGPSFLVVSSH